MPFDFEDAVEFAENPEPRCPCVLLLDTSGSMDGRPIQALQDGIDAFRYDVQLDPVSVRRVEVAVVTFDTEVHVVQDFMQPDRLELPALVASGRTHMAAGIQAALDLVEARKAAYRAHDVAYYRPWVFMITDGEPQGEPAAAVREATERLQAAEAEKRVAFFAVGVEGANLKRLAQISVRAPLKLRGLDFRDLFVWLSRSMQSIAHSRPEDRIALPPTGWAEI
ncbi:MAG TPA: VWA domain-containing protein [Longimicrobiaceae bacterium]|nr:VWA domain-containing protein [Longimicrobiaceae bacterium]